MPKENKLAINTTRPKYGRVLTETIQPRGSSKPPGKVPALISGVGTSPRQTSTKGNGKRSEKVSTESANS